MKKIILPVLLLSLALQCSAGRPAQPRNGDIIFHQSVSSQGKELELATGSRYTHMGIIYITNEKQYVYEAVQPVRLTPLSSFIKRGRNGHYVIKRLKNADSLLNSNNLRKIKQVGNTFKGKNYDNYFKWDDSRIYCSELVWKVYKRALGIELAPLERFSDFNLDNPMVKKLIRKRYGNRKLPMDEPVISPVGIFKSRLLVTVAESGN